MANTNTPKVVEVEIIKAENGQTVRFKSAITPTQINLVKSVRPELLELRNEDKKVEFKVTVGTTAEASNHGIVIPNADTTNFLVTVHAPQEAMKFVVLSIATKFEKVLQNVQLFTNEIAKANDQITVRE